MKSEMYSLIIDAMFLHLFAIIYSLPNETLNNPASGTHIIIFIIIIWFYWGDTHSYQQIIAHEFL
jgi:hypothetical protein